jgi:prephenate dehydratase
MDSVAYLGPQGTFTFEAATALFPKYERVPYPSIPDVLSAVAQGKVPHGVVPVENAIEGSVNLTLDWLIHHADVPITAELVYPITQCLMAHPQQGNRSLQDFARVLSHPQAIAQCQHFLRKHLPQAQVEFVDSTAAAAAKVLQYPEEAWAAIGPRSAQELMGLALLKPDIQDYDNNFTRFIAVGEPLTSEPLVSPAYQKSSLLVALPSDYPGALYKVLASFATHGINLSRIESRPTKTGLGNYHFFIDAEQSLDHPAMAEALREVEAGGCQVRRFGSYFCYPFRQKPIVKTY